MSKTIYLILTFLCCARAGFAQDSLEALDKEGFWVTPAEFSAFINDIEERNSKLFEIRPSDRREQARLKLRDRIIRPLIEVRPNQNSREQLSQLVGLIPKIKHWQPREFYELVTGIQRRGDSTYFFRYLIEKSELKSLELLLWRIAAMQEMLSSEGINPSPRLDADSVLEKNKVFNTSLASHALDGIIPALKRIINSTKSETKREDAERLLEMAIDLYPTMLVNAVEMLPFYEVASRDISSLITKVEDLPRERLESETYDKRIAALDVVREFIRSFTMLARRMSYFPASPELERLVAQARSKLVESFESAIGNDVKPLVPLVKLLSGWDEGNFSRVGSLIPTTNNRFGILYFEALHAMAENNSDLKSAFQEYMPRLESLLMYTQDRQNELMESSTASTTNQKVSTRDFERVVKVHRFFTDGKEPPSTPMILDRTIPLLTRPSDRERMFLLVMENGDRQMTEAMVEEIAGTTDFSIEFLQMLDSIRRKGDLSPKHLKTLDIILLDQARALLVDSRLSKSARLTMASSCIGSFGVR